jgi:hypothetical protein
MEPSHAIRSSSLFNKSPPPKMGGGWVGVDAAVMLRASRGTKIQRYVSAISNSSALFGGRNPSLPAK